MVMPFVGDLVEGGAGTAVCPHHEVDGDKITDIAATVEPANGQVLRVGKRKFARITVG